MKRDLLVKNEKCDTYNFSEDFLIRAKIATYHGLKAYEGNDEASAPLDDVSGKILQMLTPTVAQSAPSDLISRCNLMSE